MHFCYMKKPLDILLIEDDIDDVDLLKEALNDNEVPYQMDIIMEADKVFLHLNSLHKMPGIIIMDLNLPKSDGKQILSEIKARATFKSIPLIILTTSSFKDDIEYCNSMGVSKYLTKPATIDGWNMIIKSIVAVADASA